MKFIIPRRAMRVGRRIIGLLQIMAAYVILYWIFGFRTSMSVDRSGMRGVKPPFIVLGNHTSNFDPALVQVVVAPYPCYFLTTNFYFRLPIIGRILKIIGAIPKIQFFPDMRSMRGAVEVIGRGDVVGIFPEGRRSIDGSCCAIPESIAKLIKKLKVPVISVRTDGGYFIWPRWSSFWRFGHVETVAKQILTTDDICKLGLKEIYDVVCQALAYNDYDWNRSKRVRSQHKNAAEQLHLILHQCPRCLAPQVMKSMGTRLYCRACDNTAIVDAYGYLQPLDDQCVVFDDPVKWNDWQRKNMITRLQDDDFQIHAKVKDLRRADKYYGAYRSCGYGHIILRKDGMRFHGEVDGQETELFFSIEMMPSVSTEFKDDFEVCDYEHAWWFFLEEEQHTVQLEMAISLIYEQIQARKK